MTNQVAITMLKNLEQSLDDYCELNDEGKTAFSMAISALELFGNSEQLTSVQPRKGKWAGKGDSEGFGIFICDNCGKVAMMEYDFCPNCGSYNGGKNEA